MRREDRERILTEVQSRVSVATVASAERAGRPLEEVLADTVYYERRRIKDDPTTRTRKQDAAFLDELQHAINRAGERELHSWLRRVVSRYAHEICGNFNERVYEVVTRVLPPAVGLVVNSVSPVRLLKSLPHLPSLDEALVIGGETEHLRRLHEVGTVILTPTHVSNLDSIVLGLAVYRLGLPPVIYGAGLNLFSNPVVGYFMHNLGAYTVDRRKQDPLYKNVLKEYATLTLEYGYDNLFFPGGTRSRSGAIEQHLKLGLLGTVMHAYVNNLRRNAPRPRLFVVPVTLSFQLVLEAETLIDDFLKEVGKARYIISDDEFAQPRRMFEFVSQLMSLNSKIYLTVGRGYDPLGNPVDDDGQSLDPHGRSIDIGRYTWVDGTPRHLPQRDQEYTRELGAQLRHSFARDNLVQATHVTARAMFSLLRRLNPTTDPVRLLRLGGKVNDADLREVYGEVDRLCAELRGLADRGGIRLAPELRQAAADDVVDDGLRHFAIYHHTPAVTRRGDRLFATDRGLLFYYQNRLEGYRLERSLGMAPLLSDDRRSLRAP